MPPQPPYIISGIVKDANSILIQGATVQVYDLINGQVASGLTNSQGEYTLSLLAYTDGDILLIRASKDGSFYKYFEVRVVLDATQGITNKNITLLVRNPIQNTSINQEDLALMEHNPLYLSKQVTIVGETDTGEIIPVKVKKDSTGRIGNLETTSIITPKMARLETTTSSVASLGTLTQSFPFVAKGLIRYIRVYASASTNFDFYLYDANTQNNQDELMRQINAGSRGISGNRVYSETFRQMVGLPYFDRSGNGQIHIKIVNQDASNASTFQIIILGDEYG